MRRRRLRVSLGRSAYTHPPAELLYIRRASECLLAGLCAPDESLQLPRRARPAAPSSLERAPPPADYSAPPLPHRPQLVHASRPRTTTSVESRTPSSYPDDVPPSAATKRADAAAPPPVRFGRVFTAGRPRVESAVGRTVRVASERNLLQQVRASLSLSSCAASPPDQFRAAYRPAFSCDERVSRGR